MIENNIKTLSFEPEKHPVNRELSAVQTHIIFWTHDLRETKKKSDCLIKFPAPN